MYSEMRNGGTVCAMGWMRSILIPAGVQGNFLLSKMSTPTLVPTQLPIPWVLWVLSLGVKWPRREGGRSFLSNAKINIEYSYTYIPLDAFKMNFTFIYSKT